MKILIRVMKGSTTLFARQLQSEVPSKLAKHGDSIQWYDQQYPEDQSMTSTQMAIAKNVITSAFGKNENYRTLHHHVSTRGSSSSP